jgi:hypothetical protein
MLADDPLYAELFAAAFPDESDPITLDNLTPMAVPLRNDCLGS